MGNEVGIAKQRVLHVQDHHAVREYQQHEHDQFHDHSGLQEHSATNHGQHYVVGVVLWDIDQEIWLG